jgi:hypothetical protein
MGTNYYLQKRGRNGRCYDIHIVKTSHGHIPLFRAYTEEMIRVDFPYLDFSPVNSFIKWKFILLSEIQKGSLIFNEYDELIELDDFLIIVESFKKHLTKKLLKTEQNFLIQTDLDSQHNILVKGKMQYGTIK